MRQPHPITTLSPEALTGWIACARYHLAVEDRGIALALMSMSADIAEDMLGRQSPAPSIPTSAAPAAPLADPALPPRPALSTPAHGNSLFSPARETLLRRLYPTVMPLDGVLAAINALPGKPCSSAQSIKSKAKKMVLHRRKLPIPAAYLPTSPAREAPAVMVAAETPQSGISAIPADEMQEARSMMRSAKCGSRNLSEYFGWAPELAIHVASAIRDELAAGGISA